MIIIGSGIIGLSLAEYFSRNPSTHVLIISDENPLSGSSAAAANLSTKGQQFARDPHFEMKLKSKSIYPHWIADLLTEAKTFGYAGPNFDELFVTGNGLDLFPTEEAAKRQLKRVSQPQEELLKRGMQQNTLRCPDSLSVLYSDEAWVNAAELLSLLRFVCIKRGVKFSHQKVSSLSDIPSNASRLIIAAGAWTGTILKALELELPHEMKKSTRLSLGSTLSFATSYSDISKNTPHHPALVDFHSQVHGKITLSGNQKTTFLSSTSVKIPSLADVSSTSLDGANLKLETAGDEYFAHHFASVQKNNISVRTGVRVGYGHSEIAMENVLQKIHGMNVTVCCGAHKSGYLFAPIIGHYVHLLP